MCAGGPEGGRRVDRVLSTSGARHIAAALVIAATVLAVFGPALGYGFSYYDDNYQVLNNPLIRDLSPRGLARMFTRRSLTSYYPVRVLSLAFDYAVWGARPAGYHLTSVLLHALNAVLVYGLCVRLCVGFGARTGGRQAPRMRFVALFGALLFAVHPVVVEPVVWVGGREELLMVLFVLCALLAHARRAAPADGRDNTNAAGGGPATLRVAVWPSIFCVLACLSNVVGAVTPLLVVAHNAAAALARRTRPLGAGLFRGTAVMWAVAVVTIVVKLSDSAATADYEIVDTLRMTAGQRVLTVFSAYWLNVTTVLWPRTLVAMYPKTVAESVLEPGVWLGGGAVLCTAWCLWGALRRPVVAFGLLWFLCALAPAAQVLPHHILRADRFLYLPLVGVACAVCGLLRPAVRSRAAGALCVAVLLVLGLRSVRQRRFWHDSMTLFAHELSVNPENLASHYNLANLLAKEGRLKEAVQHYAEAARLRPDFGTAEKKLGAALTELGQIDAALVHFSRALALSRPDPDLHSNVGAALASRGRLREALPHYSRALALAPRHKSAHCNLGVALAALGKEADAKKHYSKALEVDPQYADAHNNLAIVLAAEGERHEAIRHYSAALAAKPGYADAHFNLGVVLLEAGNTAEAAAHFSEAVRYKKPFPQAEHALALLRGRKSEVGSRKSEVRDAEGEP